MERFQITIDTSLCSGLGSCVDLSPAHFQLDDGGTAFALVDACNEDSVIEAARSCPMAAISVYDVTSGKDVA